MNSFLREAFGLVCYPFHKIQELYDLTGYYSWRAMMDDQFLAVSPAAFDSRPLQHAAQAYEWLLPRARAAAIEGLHTRSIRGDYGPKPDIKPGLIRLGGAFLAQASRIPWNNPVVMGTVLLSFAAATYAMTHGAAHSMPDVVGTIYGSSPGSPRAARN